MEAYFDNSATTRCYPEVAEIVVKTMTEDFGNPSAMHLKGVEAEKYVREAAQILAKILKVNPILLVIVKAILVHYFVWSFALHFIR